MGSFSDVNIAAGSIVRGLMGGFIDRLEEAKKAAFRDAVQELAKDLKEAFNDIINNFYNDYSPLPNEYVRNFSLYNLLQIKISDDGLSLKYDFDPSLMTSFRAAKEIGAENGLYHQTFRKGWHGGADRGPGHPSPGTPYWRGGYRYSLWLRPAKVMKVPPLEQFKRWKEEYETVIGPQKLDAFEAKYIKEMKLF